MVEPGSLPVHLGASGQPILVPEDGISGSGLAALAAKTQQDWQDQIKEPFTDSVNPLEQLFLTIASDLIEFFSNLVDLPGMLEVLNDILTFFYNLLDRSGFFEVIDAVVGFFQWLFDTFSDVIESLLKPVFEWVAWLWDLFDDQIEALLKPLFEFLKWLIEEFGDVIEAVLKPLLQVAKAIFELVGDVFLTNLFDLLKWFFDLITIESFEEFLDDIFNFFTDILNPERFVEIFKAIFKFLAQLFEALNLQAIIDILEEIVGYLIKFFTGTLDVSGLTLANLFEAVKTFLSRIPFVGELLGLAGKGATVDGKPVTRMPDLVQWFQENVLTRNSQIPATNLVGTIPAKLLGSLGVGNIDNTTPNQVDLNGFPSAATMQQGGQWVWDGGVSRQEGSGSAKVTCNAGQSYLYSNKVPVATGQLLSLSAWVRWQSVTNSTALSSPISIGVRTYNQGVLQQSLAVVASVPTVGFTATQTNWTQVANAIAWTVPSNVTEVRMAIGVNQSATAGTVWFDDIALRKTNNMAQNLVTDLVPVFNAAIDGLSGNGQGTSTLTSATPSALYTPASGTRGLAGTADGNAALALAGASGAKVDAAAAASGASGANAKAQTTIDGINGAVATGSASTAVGQAASSVLTAFQSFNTHVFGVGNNQPGQSFSSGRIPNISANKLTTGKPSNEVLNNILPTSQSGAMIARRNTTNVINAVNRNLFAEGFFTDVEIASNDIDVLQNNTTGKLRGIFRATIAGWYVVELSFRLDPGFTLGFQYAPLLYRTTNYGTLSLAPYKIGGDVALSPAHPTAVGLTTPHVPPRYAQSTWVIYLPVNGAVGAGYDAGNATGLVPGDAAIDADATGIETYFSIAMLNKTAT